MPVLIRHRADISFARNRGAVHEVDIVIAGGLVPPQDVFHAVAIEIADAHHLPVLVSHCARESFGAQNRRAIHRVDVVLTGGDIAPQNIRPPIAIEVGDGDDLPARVRHRAHESLPGENGGAVHRINVGLSRSPVSPENIRLAVAIEIGELRCLR